MTEVRITKSDLDWWLEFAVTREWTFAKTYAATWPHEYVVRNAENAAMILSGMGPVTELKNTSAKVFAGLYAILSGLIIIIASSFVLAPMFHRVLHSFHVEGEGDDGEDGGDGEERRKR